MQGMQRRQVSVPTIENRLAPRRRSAFKVEGQPLVQPGRSMPASDTMHQRVSIFMGQRRIRFRGRKQYPLRRNMNLAVEQATGPRWTIGELLKATVRIENDDNRFVRPVRQLLSNSSRERL